MYFSIIIEIVTYILGIQSVPERNFKCSKGLTDYYNGIYNKTLGKLNYDRSEEYNQKLWDEWEEFEIGTKMLMMTIFKNASHSRYFSFHMLHIFIICIGRL